MTEQLTVKQALEQGYTHYGYEKWTDYQRLCSIEDISEDDFNAGVILLAQKEKHFFTVDEDDIKEAVVDTLVSNYCDQSGDDDGDNIHTELSDLIQVADLVNVVNEFFAKHSWRYLTKIELIP